MRLGCSAEILDEQMRVRPERDANVAVPHETLNAIRVDAAAEQLRRERVAQVVEADRNVERHGPEPPPPRFGERSSATIGGLTAGRAEARLGIAGAFLVPAPAVAVFVPIHDSGARQGVPENLLRVGFALSLRAIPGREDQRPRCVLELMLDPRSQDAWERQYRSYTALRGVAVMGAGDGDGAAHEVDIALPEREEFALAQAESRAGEEGTPVLRDLDKHLPDLLRG